jgi:hypothetical protein
VDDDTILSKQRDCYRQYTNLSVEAVGQRDNNSLPRMALACFRYSKALPSFLPILLPASTSSYLPAQLLGTICSSTMRQASTETYGKPSRWPDDGVCIGARRYPHHYKLGC